MLLLSLEEERIDFQRDLPVLSAVTLESTHQVDHVRVAFVRPENRPSHPRNTLTTFQPSFELHADALSAYDPCLESLERPHERAHGLRAHVGIESHRCTRKDPVRHPSSSRDAAHNGERPHTNVRKLCVDAEMLE